MPKEVSYRRASKLAGDLSFPEAVDHLGIVRYSSDWKQNPAHSYFPFIRRRSSGNVRGRSKLKYVRRQLFLEGGNTRLARKFVRLIGCEKHEVKAFLKLQGVLVREVLQALHDGRLRGKLYPAYEESIRLNDRNFNLVRSSFQTALCTGYIRLRRGLIYTHALVTIEKKSLSKLTQIKPKIHTRTDITRSIQDRDRDLMKTFIDEKLLPKLTEQFGDELQKCPKFTEPQRIAIARHVVAVREQTEAIKLRLSKASLKELGDEYVPEEFHSRRGPPTKSKREQLNQLLENLGIDMSEP